MDIRGDVDAPVLHNGWCNYRYLRKITQLTIEDTQAILGSETYLVLVR